MNSGVPASPESTAAKVVWTRSRGWLLAGLGGLFVVRLLIAWRGGGLGGDDVQILENAARWWREGEASYLITNPSSGGIVYAGLHNVIWATLAGWFDFRLGPLYFVHGLMLAVPAVALWWHFRDREDRGWMVALALSSPLVAYFSTALLPFWILCMLGGWSAVGLIRQSTRGREVPVGPLVLHGLLQGYTVAAYPSLALLVGGLIFWWVWRGSSLRSWIVLGAALAVGFAPLPILLVLHWSELTPVARLGSGPVDWLALLAGIFRFIGLPTFEWQAAPGPWRSTEQMLRTITLVLWAGAWLAIAGAAWRTRGNRAKWPPEFVVALGAYALLVPFSFVTRTEAWFHQAQNLWWVPAVTLPWALSYLGARFKSGALTLMLVVNLAGLLVWFGPRTMLGTTSEPASPRHGRGPSWWMQSEIAGELANLAAREKSAGITDAIAVRIDPIYYLPESFPALFRAIHPEHTGKLAWVAQRMAGHDLAVTRDPARPHRLKLLPAHDRWHVADAPTRSLVEILLADEADGPVQVAIDLPGPPGARQVVATDGRPVTWFLDEPVGRRREHRLWLRLDRPPRAMSRVWIYTLPAEGTPETRGDPATFPVFDDFSNTQGLADHWEADLKADWTVREGNLLATKPRSETNGAALLLWRGRRERETSGIWEARVRFTTYPASTDVGLVLGHGEGRGYLWSLNGNGPTAFTSLAAPEDLLNLAGTNWYWKGRAGRWSILEAAWSGPRMWLRVDDRTVFDTIDPAFDGTGAVGLGLLRGNGKPEIEIDWVRERVTPRSDRYTVRLGEVEKRPPPLP